VSFCLTAQHNANDSICGQTTFCQHQVESFKSIDGAIIISSTQLDNQGNTFNIGTFFNTVDFDPNPLIDYFVSSISFANCFIQKLDTAGNLIWVKIWGGFQSGPFYSASYINAFDFSFDKQGNIYIVGKFRGSIDFDPSPTAIDSIVSSGASGSYGYTFTNDGYILKLDSNANYMWTNTLGSFYIESDYDGSIYISGSDEVTEIEHDSNDNLIIGGVYDGINNFNGNILYPFDTYYGLYYFNSPFRASFAAKINKSTGDVIWAEGISSGLLHALEIDNLNNIIVAKSKYVIENYNGYFYDLELDYEIVLMEII